MAADSPRRLLVLDDEPDVAFTMCMIAEGVSFTTHHTSDVEEFLDKVVTWTPTHVAVDLQMPGRDGIEVLHNLASMRCEAAVIIVSGLGGRILSSAARVAVENGLHLIGTLSKPYTRFSLREVLTTVVPDARSRNAFRQDENPPLITEKEIANALCDRAFSAHFQPKILCSTYELAGFECLARWFRDDGSAVPPDTFIKLVEKTGQIHELTRQVYDFALANFPRPENHENLSIALNISPVNLNDETFPQWLTSKCREYEIAPSQVILEVTETASPDNPLMLLENLTQFRIKGFHLSIDDFGVGYSSLVQLARLPFSELKIDRTFVQTAASSGESRKIIIALISLGKSLGLEVTAEGVEDSWALNFLHDVGCDKAQGYFIAKPMDSVAASRWKKFTTEG